MPDEIPETDPRARAGNAHYLLEKILDTALVEPLTDVRQRQRIDAVVFAGRQVLGVPRIDDLQPVEPAPQELPQLRVEIRRHATRDLSGIRPRKHLMKEVIRAYGHLAERVLDESPKVFGEARVLYFPEKSRIVCAVERPAIEQEREEELPPPVVPLACKKFLLLI